VILNQRSLVILRGPFQTQSYLPVPNLSIRSFHQPEKHLHSKRLYQSELIHRALTPGNHNLAAIQKEMIVRKGDSGNSLIEYLKRGRKSVYSRN